MQVVISTRNKNKLQEISRILGTEGIETVGVEMFPGAPEIEEDGRTFAENAAKKALTIARFTKRLTLADDSGLEVEALAGAPGVYSARYSGENATYETNNQKLLAELAGLPPERRTARFICSVAVADPGGVIGIVEGEYPGRIIEEPRGSNGFGYDPVFFSPEYGKTLAEMDPKVKNRISHRARAFQKAKELVRKYQKEIRGSSR